MTAKKKCLLHICCAPCATQTIETLKDEFDIEGYFYNPNIEPVDEYDARMNAMLKLNEYACIDLFFGDYDNCRWREFIKGYENEKEGGRRCELCIEFRLRKAAYFAAYRKIKYFTTTLSISPHKNFEFIKKTGLKIADEYGLIFIDTDFKQNNGFRKSVEFSKKIGLYRQKYCGCKFPLIK